MVRGGALNRINGTHSHANETHISYMLFDIRLISQKTPTRSLIVRWWPTALQRTRGWRRGPLPARAIPIGGSSPGGGRLASLHQFALELPVPPSSSSARAQLSIPSHAPSSASSRRPPPPPHAAVTASTRAVPAGQASPPRA